MTSSAKKKLKIVLIGLLALVAVAAAVIAFVPAAKKWALEQWEKIKAMFAKKK